VLGRSDRATGAEGRVIANGIHKEPGPRFEAGTRFEAGPWRRNREGDPLAASGTETAAHVSVAEPLASPGMDCPRRWDMGGDPYSPPFPLPR
jgi:hypothetical protein